MGAKLICALASTEPKLITAEAVFGKITKLPEDLNNRGKVKPVFDTENATEFVINQISLVDGFVRLPPIYAVAACVPETNPAVVKAAPPPVAAI